MESTIEQNPENSVTTVTTAAVDTVSIASNQSFGLGTVFTQNFPEPTEVQETGTVTVTEYNEGETSNSQETSIHPTAEISKTAPIRHQPLLDSSSDDLNFSDSSMESFDEVGNSLSAARGRRRRRRSNNKLNESGIKLALIESQKMKAAEAKIAKLVKKRSNNRRKAFKQAELKISSGRRHSRSRTTRGKIMRRNLKIATASQRSSRRGGHKRRPHN